MANLELMAGITIFSFGVIIFGLDILWSTASYDAIEALLSSFTFALWYSYSFLFRKRMSFRAPKQYLSVRGLPLTESFWSLNELDDSNDFCGICSSNMGSSGTFNWDFLELSLETISYFSDKTARFFYLLGLTAVSAVRLTRVNLVFLVFFFPFVGIRLYYNFI